MGGRAGAEEELTELVELVHSTCQQVIAGAGYVHREGLQKALTALGRSLGLDRPRPKGKDRRGIDVVLARRGAAAVAVAVDGGLSVTKALGLLDTGAPVGLLVVASGLGEGWMSGLDAFVRAAGPSRGGALGSSGVAVVLLNLALEGGDVVDVGALAPVRWFPLADLLRDPDPARGRFVRAIEEPSSTVSLGPGARDNVDREAYPMFPYDRVRVGQRTFLDDVRDACDKGGVLVAHAPTGIGKTASALVPAVQHALDEGTLVMFLTPKQSQHRVAVDTLRKMAERSTRPIRVVDVIAKQAMCPRVGEDEHHAAFHEFCRGQVRAGKCSFHMRGNAQVVKAISGRIMHVHELVATARRARVCPHKAAMDAAAGAHVVVCDYNYVFVPELAEAVIERLDRGWEDVTLIVDEAHNLPDRAREAASGSLSGFLLEGAHSELKGADAGLRALVARLSSRLDGLALGLPQGDEREVAPQEWVSAVESDLSSGLEPMSYVDLVEALEGAGERLASGDELTGSAVAQVATFLRGFPLWGDAMLRTVTSDDGGPRLQHHLLDPSLVTAERFASVHAAVLMSGTLWPPRMYADLLGLPADRLRVGEYRSPFPPENRLVLVTPGLTTRYTSRGPEMFGAIARAVGDVLAATPGNVAVFAPSYDLLGRIREGLSAPGACKKELLVEDRGMGKREREGLCDRLEELRGTTGGVLLGVQGGSLSEGVDYLENLLSAVVVVGLPLAPPSREVDALIGYFDRKFGRGHGEGYGYTNPAMNRVVQAAGRLIRTERDRGVVVLMDERFLQRRYLGCFPPDWTPRRSQDLGREVGEFFRAGGPGGGPGAGPGGGPIGAGRPSRTR
jgi:DNA excision repair protein ERCC-2